jgi:hypothetical protein
VVGFWISDVETVDECMVLLKQALKYFIQFKNLGIMLRTEIMKLWTLNFGHVCCHSVCNLLFIVCSQSVN